MPSRAARQAGRPTREETARLDEEIRLAAVRAFIDRGFDGVTMEEIARAAGVGKPSLYARYSDKVELFAAVVPWALQHLKWSAPDIVIDDGDLRASLLSFARAAYARSVDPMMVGLFRMAMAESPRFPQIALTADEITRSPLVRLVVELLQRHAADGELDVADVETAAEHFVGMVHLTPLTFAAFGFRRDDASDDAQLRSAVDLFLDGIRTRRR